MINFLCHKSFKFYSSPCYNKVAIRLKPKPPQKQKSKNEFGAT